MVWHKRGVEMKISELKEGITNVEFEARVVQLGEVRQVSTRFGPKQVADNVLEDDTGQIKLTLWGDDIQKVKIGDTVKITGGYVKAWQGDLQVSVGRNGNMAVESGVAGAEGAGAEAADAELADAEAPAEGAGEEGTEDATAEEAPVEEPIGEAPAEADSGADGAEPEKADTK